MMMAPRRPLCSSRLLRLLIFVFVLSVLLLTYWLNYWTISIESRDTAGGTKRLHIVTKLNWTSGHHSPKGKSDRSPASDPLSLGPTDEVAHLLSTFGVNSDNVNHVNVGDGVSSGLSVHNTLNKNYNYQHNNNSNKASNLHLTHAKSFHQNSKDTVLLNGKDRVSQLVKDFIPNVHLSKVNCAKVISGDSIEMAKAEAYQRAHAKVEIPPEYYTAKARNCQSFRQSRRYTTEPLSQEEADFPIAYSLLVFQEIELVERLLRAVYHPQNYYCVHVDAKAPSSFRAAVSAIAECFDNVFMSSRSVDVQWGWYSVLEPEIVCMEDLWKYSKKWKYFINLTGQEFPLKTNGDLVKILKAMNGANNVHGTVKRRNSERTLFVHQGIYTNHKVRKGPPPVPVTLTKGSLHVVVKREYVDYILNDKGALAFRDWIKDTGVPDETFFSSLNYSPKLNVPGSYKGIPETDSIDGVSPRNPFFARFKNWGDSVFNWPCHGKRVRMICVFGVRDLPLLATRKELFANKFHLKYNPLAYDCLEELHYNRTRESVLGTRSFDAKFYAALDIVRNHVL